MSVYIYPLQLIFCALPIQNKLCGKERPYSSWQQFHKIPPRVRGELIILMHPFVLIHGAINNHLLLYLRLLQLFLNTTNPSLMAFYHLMNPVLLQK